ncbi:MAG: MFS transporter [Pigmentiphaga sp.]
MSTRPATPAGSKREQSLVAPGGSAPESRDAPAQRPDPASPDKTDGNILSRRLVVWIFIAFASGHFLSYGLRTINAALAPYLVADLELGAADLGWLSASYYIAFAALQYPLGFWLDRYGERRVESLLLVIAACGAALMAFAPSLTWMTWGRILIGLGVSACLMAPFAWFRRHFPPQRQSQLGLLLLVAGTSGAATATLPAATLAIWLGWRGVFLIFAVLLLLSAALIWSIVPDGRPAAVNRHAGAEAKPNNSAGQRSLIRHPIMLSVMALAFIGHGGLMALHTLWAGPWMTDVLGIAPTWAASYLLVFMVTMLLSYLTMSFVAPRLQRRGLSMLRIAAYGNGLSALLIVLIAVLPYPWAWLLWPLLAIAFPANSLLQPGLSVLFPRQMAGRVMTLYNLYLFSGAFAVQWGMGLLIEGLQSAGLSSTAAFQFTLGGLGILFWVALLWWWRRGGLG